MDEREEGEKINVLSLFSGIGGIELGLESLGVFKTVGYVENDPYAQAVLIKQMEEGNLSSGFIWDDIKTFDGKPFRGIVQLVAGGFPCQDISSAGKGKGIKKGTRSGLWFEFKRVVGEVRPKYIFLENVSALIKRGLDIVLAGLSEIGYDAVWFPLQASDVGAPHRRERIFIVGWDSNNSNLWKVGQVPKRLTDTARNNKDVADLSSNGSFEESDRGIDKSCMERKVSNTSSERCTGKHISIFQRKLQETSADSERCSKDVSNSESIRLQRFGPEREQIPKIYGKERIPVCLRSRQEQWSVEPDVGRVADGVSNRLDRLKCLGNAVVPQVAREIGKVILWLEYLNNNGDIV